MLITRLSAMSKRKGATQLGRCAMSANVFDGLNSTPVIRAMALIGGGAWGSGRDVVVVTIEDSSTTSLRSTASWKALRMDTGEYFNGGIVAQDGEAVSFQLPVFNKKRKGKLDIGLRQQSRLGQSWD